jgi:transketolase
MLNRAIGDADAFSKMLQKVQRTDTERAQQVQRMLAPEVANWNAEVERKRAEKKARKAQHTKAINDLR